MKRILTISVILLLFIILGLSSSNTTAQEQKPLILQFNGDMSVMKEEPSALLVKDITLLTSYSQDLMKIADQTVILYEGSLNELSETLKIPDSPKVNTETTTVILSAYYTRNNKAFVGQILIPNNNPDQDKDQAYADFVSLIMDKADKYGGQLRVPRSFTNSFNMVFLPLVSYIRGAYWDPMPILITTVLDCPFGKYNDVVIGQQVANEDNPYRDYWGTQLEQQILPGNENCNEGTSWYNEKVWNMLDTWSPGIMYKYGPFSTFNEQTTSVSIGFNEGGFSLGWSWTFPVLDVNVYDYSDFGYPRMEHKFDLSGNAAYYTYTSQPGLSLTIDEYYRPFFYRPMNLYWDHWLYGSHHLWDYWYIEF